MANHFAAIGCPITDDASYEQAVTLAWENAEERPAPEGGYLRWQSGEGGEIWLQIDPEGMMIASTPFFEGKSRLRVLLTHRVHHSNCTAYEGACHAWMNPTSEMVESGDYPFVFDLVDYAAEADRELPQIAEVRLTGFAHELSVYASEAEYEALDSGEPRFAVESFIPVGLFAADDQADAEPLSYALFTGVVVEASQLEGQMGGRYQWALVRTLGGEIDVVIEPALHAGPLQPGMVLSGTYWMCGRIL